MRLLPGRRGERIPETRHAADLLDVLDEAVPTTTGDAMKLLCHVFGHSYRARYSEWSYESADPQGGTVVRSEKKYEGERCRWCADWIERDAPQAKRSTDLDIMPIHALPDLADNVGWHDDAA